MTTNNPINNIVYGVTNGSNAPAGAVGEYLSSIVPPSTPVILGASGSPVTLTTLILSAGDWHVWGEMYLGGTGTGASAQITWATALIGNNPSSITAPSDNSAASGVPTPSGTAWVLGGTAAPTLAIAPCRYNVNTSTTVYLVGVIYYSANTMGIYGKLCALRMR